MFYPFLQSAQAGLMSEKDMDDVELNRLADDVQTAETSQLRTSVEGRRTYSALRHLLASDPSDPDSTDVTVSSRVDAFDGDISEGRSTEEASFLRTYSDEREAPNY